MSEINQALAELQDNLKSLQNVRVGTSTLSEKIEALTESYSEILTVLINIDDAISRERGVLFSETNKIAEGYQEHIDVFEKRRVAFIKSLDAQYTTLLDAINEKTSALEEESFMEKFEDGLNRFEKASLQLTDIDSKIEASKKGILLSLGDGKSSLTHTLDVMSDEFRNILTTFSSEIESRISNISSLYDQLNKKLEGLTSDQEDWKTKMSKNMNMLFGLLGFSILIGIVCLVMLGMR